MAVGQKILQERRHYNKWVADQTLEDYALRFTAVAGRHMSISKVGMTALGAISFLALEGLAAVVTLSYGFSNALWAMLAVCLVLFITGFPIAYHCAKNGLDIDLLTRGAGFGYLGSTLTSLIYASFTFIFFAIEAAILAAALKALLGMPLFIGYIMCAFAVIPIVTHGIKAISKFQVGTQFVWLLLQVLALLVVVYYESDQINAWVNYSVSSIPQSNGFDLALFGAAVSVLIVLIAQIGEQADYLRFLPPKTQANRKQWWFWLIFTGPGWVWVGLVKMLLGSFLAYLAVTQLLPFEQAIDPTLMYQRVFQNLTQSPSLALILAALMVILCQMKINVTNAYAGSIAWSNFFSRLTHTHPGRVVWLVFNVAIALLLMELGIYQALEAILGSFAILAIAWLGSVAAHLLINRPLKLCPAEIEFKRAHLYDINPVGVGSMLVSALVGYMAFFGIFGAEAKYLCHFLTLFCCFTCVPIMALITKGRFYLARQSPELNSVQNKRGERPLIHPAAQATLACGICENHFELPDMSYCPAYAKPICSLCCSLDVRCLDACKPKTALTHRFIRRLYSYFPAHWVRFFYSKFGRFIALTVAVNSLLASMFILTFHQFEPQIKVEAGVLEQALLSLFILLCIASSVVAWLFLLNHESRISAQQESNRQTRKLTCEINAHVHTDRELQAAKDQAERANEAKSRYLTGISHELRTPLQSILGYAQLLSEKEEVESEQKRGLKIIYRSGLYLTDLIEGLLDISKIEAGRLDLFRSRVYLPELIEQMVEMFKIQADKKNLRLKHKVVGRLPDYVMTDEKRLRQILINLLSNAVKYTDAGQVDFEIRYRNQVAEFVVRDTGQGIESSNLDRIFQPFERVRNTTSNSLPGTGLGLTIVKLLVEIRGGNIDVSSTPAKGSQFSVSLLLSWVEQAPALDASGNKMVAYEGLQRTILLADDDPILRGLLSELLMPLGFNVIEAYDGENALELVQKNRPDLFLLDIAMPRMSGLELAQALRVRGHREPILMLSANIEDDVQKNSYRRHYNDYLVKPVNNQLLLERIGQHLDIQWVYASQPHTQPLSKVPPLSEPTSSTLPLSSEVGKTEIKPQRFPNQHELILELKAYAEMGYHKGVTSSLKRIKEQALLEEDVLQALQNLSESFQLELLVKHLEAGSI